MIQRGIHRLEFTIRAKRIDLSSRNDLRNRLIYCDPLEINQILLPKVLGKFSRHFSGFVTQKDIFSENMFPLRLHPKIKYCFAHFDSKLSWKDSRAYEYYSSSLINKKKFDKLCDLNDVTKRFQTLDLLYENVANSRELKTRFELGMSDHRFDEEGGIYVHFDSSGQPIFGGGGFHRLAIAQILKLHKIPVCIGLVHRDFEENIKNFLND